MYIFTYFLSYTSPSGFNGTISLKSQWRLGRNRKTTGHTHTLSATNTYTCI